jgi:5-methyltetrahydropteroyltriglutamate--homocysteine methyltransferase
MSIVNRIPTTHVGSLIRPPDLLKYISAIESGVVVDQGAYRACLTKSVSDVVKKQAEVGVDFVSDGEFGKFRSWCWYIMERLEGFIDDFGSPSDTQDSNLIKAIAGKDATDFPEFYHEYFGKQGLAFYGNPVCVGPIRYKGGAALKTDIDNLKSALSAVTVENGFLPVVAPGSAMPIYEDRHYRDEEKFLYAVAEALRDEYSAIVKSGLLLQVDDAYLPHVWDMIFKGKDLDKYRRWARLRIDVLNHALKGLPPERVRYHICWGSFNTPHVSDVPARDIIDLVLQVNAGAYCIEMGNPRHAHEWKIWEEVKLPDGKKLIPGVISHITNVVEHPELVAERLVRLANLVGRDNLLAGTDCGFAQGPYIRRVHPTVQWAKLKTLAEGAQLASKQLWGRKAA